MSFSFASKNGSMYNRNFQGRWTDGSFGGIRIKRIEFVWEIYVCVFFAVQHFWCKLKVSELIHFSRESIGMLYDISLVMRYHKNDALHKLKSQKKCS